MILTINNSNTSLPATSLFRQGQSLAGGPSLDYNLPDDTHCAKTPGYVIYGLEVMNSEKVLMTDLVATKTTFTAASVSFASVEPECRLGNMAACGQNGWTLGSRTVLGDTVGWGI